MGALGYDATLLTLEALKRAASADSKALTAAIEETTDLSGVSGKITLKGMNGNPPKRALVVEIRPLPDFQVFRKAYEHADIK